jgi:hypothetical protein
MGCRLVRGETIYFVRHGGPTTLDVEAPWYGDEHDACLLPCVYTRSDGRSLGIPQSVVPIEIRSFEA